MNVLILCEYSGVVRSAYRARGFNAFSCDILPDETGSQYHYRCDAFELLCRGYPIDHIVAHPPCTHILNTGIRWIYKGGRKSNGLDIQRLANLVDGARFFRDLWNTCRELYPKASLAFENPVMAGYAKDLIGIGNQAQTVQPWWFGDKKVKATCWWLHNLPLLEKTNDVGPPPKEGEPDYKNWAEVHHMSPGKDRGKRRSKFYPGMAKAMAEQWCRGALA